MKLPSIDMKFFAVTLAVLPILFAQSTVAAAAAKGAKGSAAAKGAAAAAGAGAAAGAAGAAGAAAATGAAKGAALQNSTSAYTISFAGIEY